MGDKAATFGAPRWTSCLYRSCGRIILSIFILFGYLSKVADSSSLYVSNGTHILRVNRQVKDVEVVVAQVDGRIVGLAADTEENILFWSDVSHDHGGIYKIALTGNIVRNVITDVGECNGLSIDWVSKHIYWTDARKRTVEISNYDGSGRRILIGSGLDQPRGIVVDPVFGAVYWADQGTRQIEKSNLDGTDRRTIVQTDLHWPNQLAISYATRKLYWVDAWLHSIMSCDLDGKHLLEESDLRQVTKDNPTFGLVVIGNTAIISAWYSAAIYSTLVATRSGIWQEEIKNLGNGMVFSLVSTDPSIQPPNSHPCGDRVTRAGCSHLCLPIGGSTFRCACPSYGGLTLGYNRQTCEVSHELLFYTMKDTGEVGFVSLDGALTPDLTLVGWSPHPSAVTYDPLEKMVYWSDVLEHTIYRAKLDGTKREVFLNASDGLGIVDGLSLDWVSRRLYFTNMGQSSPRLDGAVYTWHRIEIISLNKRMRRTIVNDVEKPRGLQVDLVSGYLYYGDWGIIPKIVRSYLDGTFPETLLDHSLTSPNGIAVQDGKLYVSDSSYRNQTVKSTIFMYDLSTHAIQNIKGLDDVKVPMGLAISGEKLYYTDWGKVDGTAGYIKSHQLRYRVQSQVLLSGNKPTSLHYSPYSRPIQSMLNAVCDNAACSDECIQTPIGPSGRRFQCFCPDNTAKVLAAHRAICKRPKNFILFADLNAVKMVSLDQHTDDAAVTLVYGETDSNFVALTYNQKLDMIYWSDIKSQSIYGAHLNNTEVQLVYHASYAIDGLAMDPEAQALYWTGYSNSSGHISRLDLGLGNASYTQVVQGLDSPRAVILGPKYKFLYWTEYGLASKSPEVKRARTNGRHIRILMTVGLQWPNGLATHEDKLYVADGFNRKIHKMDFDGSNQRELVYMSDGLSHVFGLTINQNALFYTDWLTKSVYMVDMVTGSQEVMATHLARPTAIVIHYTDRASCGESNGNCSEVCIPLPRGHHCSCEAGSRLNADSVTCSKLAVPWEATDDLRCLMRCSQHARCAQLVPLLQYKCVCKPGFKGNGSHCYPCEENTYKRHIGDDPCIPCPDGGVSIPTNGATLCICKSHSAKLINGSCIDKSTTSRTVDTSSDIFGFLPILEVNTLDSSEDLELQIKEKTSNTEHVIGVPIKLPYFENCPDKKSLTLNVSSNSKEAFLPISWTARDHLGYNLPILSNYPVSDGRIALQWIGSKGNKGRQAVVFETEDRWHQRTVCQFYITVEDWNPPYFTFCPEDISITTNQQYERVWWQKPHAVDNVNLGQMSGSHEPLVAFPPGNTLVSYIAEDSAGNTATCNFTVSIQQETPCDIPAIKNGKIVCGDDQSDPLMCHATCNTKFYFNELSVYQNPVTCPDLLALSQEAKDAPAHKPCLSKRDMLGRQEFGMMFKGTCSPENYSLKDEISGTIIRYLEVRNTCVEYVCIFGNISILCGEHNIERAKRRSETFTILINITVESSSGLSREDIRSIFDVIRLELINLANALTVIVDDQRYGSLPGTVQGSSVYWFCRSGEVTFDDYCAPCPAGSHYNLTSGRCVHCPLGSYQNREAATFCHLCPSGITESEGSTSHSQCVIIASLDEMSKFLIITSCTFGFVFLLTVIFLYTQYQRQKRQAERARSLSRHPRYITPNIYVTPPPGVHPKLNKIPVYEPREYIYMHEYEDIESNSMKPQASGVQMPSCSNNTKNNCSVENLYSQ